MIRYFEATDSTRLAYRDDGDGLPILCLSGLTRNSTDFQYMAPHLSGVRLIRLDYRGRGTSAWADPLSYNVPREAEDALELLDHLGIAQTAVLGTSRGGMIAMYLAQHNKDRMIGVCFNDIGPELNADGLAVIRGFIGRNPVATSLDDLARARARLLEGFSDVPDARWLQEARTHYIETDTGITVNYDPALARVFEPNPEADARLPADWWPLFDALSDLPVALIRGANSDLLSLTTAQEMRRRRPDMMFEDVPNRGHVPFLDEPEALAVLHAWIAKLKDPS